jgi:hypothetical protein
MRPAQPVPKPSTPPAGPRAAARRSARATFVPIRAVLVCLVPLLLITVLGWSYYGASVAERLRSPYHEILRPSGPIGLSAGFLAFGLFAFLWLYPMRKRLGVKRFLGPVPRWLDVHIVAGILMPVVAAVHAGYRFTGLIGLGYFAMLVVALSGVVGRYLYLRIPRSRAGVELGREQVSSERRDILAKLIESTQLDPSLLTSLLQPVRVTPRFGLVGVLVQMLRDDWQRRRAIGKVLRALRQQQQAHDPARIKRIRELARRELTLGQQLRLLEATRRIFRMWHTFHLPFAITAFVAVAIHVAVAILFGVTGFGR